MTFAVDWPLNVKHLSILNMHDGNVNGVRPLGRPRYQFKIGGLTLSELDNIVQVLKYKSRGIIGFKESDLARMRTQETLREKKQSKEEGRRECEGGRERHGDTDTDTETQRQRQRDRDRRQRQRELFHRGLNSGSLAWESAVLTIRPRSCLMQLSLYHPRFVDGTTRWRLEETRRKNGSRSVYIIYGSALSSTLCGGCLFCAVRG